MKQTDKALAKLATSLPSTTDILRGSLLQRRIRHRSGCAVCARGEGHLISVLTVSYPGGRTKQIILAKLATSLPSTTDILRGSLLQRRIRHRSGCAVCARGGGHLISVLTVSYPGGRTKQISLRPEQKPIVEQWLRNYRQIKATLERICELNHPRLLAERDSDR